jgi:hypothetical protein
MHRRLERPHPVVARVVLDLGQPERLEHRRHGAAEPAAQPFFRPYLVAERVRRAARLYD